MDEIIKLPELSFDYLAAARASRGILAGLSEVELRALAERYQRFLALKALYPDHPIAPTEIIDEMWHLHMLHPRAYHRDCVAFFGYLLDHSPGYGAEEATRPALERTFRRTAELWERTYGEAYSVAGQAFQGLIICADEEEDPAEPKPPKPKDPVPPPPQTPGKQVRFTA
jgi:hypothetical protein